MAVALATVASAGVEHLAVERSSDGSDEAAVESDARSVPTGAGDPCEDAPAAAGVAEGDGCESSCSCYTQPSGSESLSCLVIFSWYLSLLLPLCSGVRFNYFDKPTTFPSVHNSLFCLNEVITFPQYAFIEKTFQ